MAQTVILKKKAKFLIKYLNIVNYRSGRAYFRGSLFNKFGENKNLNSCDQYMYGCFLTFKIKKYPGTKIIR